MTRLLESGISGRAFLLDIEDELVLVLLAQVHSVGRQLNRLVGLLEQILTSNGEDLLLGEPVDASLAALAEHVDLESVIPGDRRFAAISNRVDEMLPVRADLALEAAQGPPGPQAALGRMAGRWLEVEALGQGRLLAAEHGREGRLGNCRGE